MEGNMVGIGAKVAAVTGLRYLERDFLCFPLAGREAISRNLGWLKLLAMVAMLFDHVAILCLRHFPHYGQAELLRAPGRLSVPVFAFLVAVGYEWFTRDRVRYALRLWVFAVISEPVYLAFFGQAGNAILPLALGATLLLSLDSLGRKSGVALFVLAVVMTEFYFFLDREQAILLEVVLVFLFHQAIRQGAWARWGGPIVLVIALLNAVVPVYLGMVFVSLALILLSVRVDWGLPELRGGKYLGYGFYPGHLLLLAMIG